MNIEIKNVPNEASISEVTRAISQVVHSEEFQPSPDERPLNFKVHLTPNPMGGLRNNGSGLLTVPTVIIGLKFLRFVDENPIKMEGFESRRKLRFIQSQRTPPKFLAFILEKTPYISPDIEEEFQSKCQSLDSQFRIDAIQFGTFFRHYSPAPKQSLNCRAFSVEWEKDCTDLIGWLKFEYEHSLIRIMLGNSMKDSVGSSIAISISSINKVALGYDGKPYICFDTITPPVMEQMYFHRSVTGNHADDSRKYKIRIGSLYPGHGIVAPYATQLRLVLHHEKVDGIDVIDRFCQMSYNFGLAESILYKRPANLPIEAVKMGFFTAKRLYQLHLELKKFGWQIAFQLDALLCNGLLNTAEITELIEPVRVLCKSHPEKYVGDLLRRFLEALEIRSSSESPMKCFDRVRKKFSYVESQLSFGYFRCCHVTFTPTRMLLEGPYATPWNRVIRKYTGHEDFFIRVAFRDEDMLQYRWEREVDGSTFLQERVGRILKDGFELAGRKFEFLAYSNSALREHSVWFMSPFNHPKEGWVSPSSVRRELGDFEKTDLMKYPSVYAARLAQAFTATDPSVEIFRDEWEEVNDIGPMEYLFTDGIGTISKSLGDRIWKVLCEKRRDRGPNAIQPSAYQIRFLGYKGVVAVDEHLDKISSKIHMRLRNSMKKFEVNNVSAAPIEIALAFEHPMLCYLNRPLIMFLEDLGVRTDAFLALQEDAVAEARTIHNSIAQFRSVLDSHSLAGSFRVPYLLKRVAELDLDINPVKLSPGIDTPFLRQLRQIAMTDILRDIKHSARIPVPGSYLLVGVADEGVAYKNEPGYQDVYTLQEGYIYVCIQQPGDTEPTFIKGSCSISRSPVCHPGDVQRVYAIGEPPQNCLFGHLKNVVVLPCVGARSLASCLGGGDLDGDLYAVIPNGKLLPSTREEPAEYVSAGKRTLDRDSTVDDICDFVVEYIHSDVLGLLSDRLLTIADQSSDGIRDDNCLWLAELCSQAVDYPKQGVPVDLDLHGLPRPLIRCKPDWHAAEVVSPRRTDYYESSRALGVLYRAITLEYSEPVDANYEKHIHIMNDPITLALKDRVRSHIGAAVEVSDKEPARITNLFGHYVDELRYISAIQTLSSSPDVRLLEAEIVVGTILAKCSQKRWRKDRIYRMRIHAKDLVRDIQRNLIEEIEDATNEELVAGLEQAWRAWEFSWRHTDKFGANSFGLISLGIIFDCLDKL